MKNLLIQFSIANMTAEQYDQVIKDLEAAGKGNIPERLFHVAAPQGDVWHVTDVWESKEAFNNFAEVMIPTLIQNGVEPVEPVISPVYSMITP